MTVADWLTRATADAEARGLAPPVPLLQTLARSTDVLRAADVEFGHPAAAATAEDEKHAAADAGQKPAERADQKAAEDADRAERDDGN